MLAEGEKLYLKYIWPEKFCLLYQLACFVPTFTQAVHIASPTSSSRSPYISLSLKP